MAAEPEEKSQLVSTSSIPKPMTKRQIMKELFKIKERVPRDEEDARYIQSFGTNQPNEMRRFFEEFGFVVVRQVLSPNECAEVMEDLYSMVERTSDFRRNVPQTWDSWPKKGHATFGVPNMRAHFTPTLLKMRAKDSLRTAFGILHGSEDLINSNDRYLYSRPTNHPATGPKPHWTRPPMLHLDLQPWIYMGQIQERYQDLDYRSHKVWIQENNNCYESQGLHLQGVVNLLDSRDTQDGGNLQLAGFARYFKQYFANIGAQTGKGAQYKFDNPGDKWMVSCATHVTMRPGSIVIWDNTQVHGGKNNESARPRAVFGIKMTPRSYLAPEQLKARQQAFRAECRVWRTGLCEEDSHGGNWKRRNRKNNKKLTHKSAEAQVKSLLGFGT